MVEYLVEAGGVEPAVRKNSYRSFSERRLRFMFCSWGARSRAPSALSRCILFKFSENWT